MQPIVWAPDGVIRFKANPIVRFLLDEATAGRLCDLNRIALEEFSTEDREHFAQLIGYSVSGFGDLSYARKKTVAEADSFADQLIEKRNLRRRAKVRRTKLS